jgi:hypothetical protein
MQLCIFCVGNLAEMLLSEGIANACVMANVHWGYPDGQETSVSGGVTAVCVVFPV